MARRVGCARAAKVVLRGSERGEFISRLANWLYNPPVKYARDRPRSNGCARRFGLRSRRSSGRPDGLAQTMPSGRSMAASARKRRSTRTRIT